MATFRRSKAIQNHVEISQDFGDVPEVFSDALLCSAGGGSIVLLLMVGAKVLFNSAKMLKMGVLVVLMHSYRDQETKRDVKQLFYP